MDIYDKIMTLAKRRGFLYQSFEIYGGLAGFYDYGPLGSLLKNNIITIWRKFYVYSENLSEISTTIITPYELLKASGHIDEFSDLVGICKKCGYSYKVDDSAIDTCPECDGELKYEQINLMFETHIGSKKKDIAFLRPETAQGIFVNFPFLYEFFRKKMPFGIVQIGKGFRNEVSPRQGMIRLREFNMAEAEIFFDPDDKTHTRYDSIKNDIITIVDENEGLHEISIDEALKKGFFKNQALSYYIGLTRRFLIAVGIDNTKIRFRQHKKDEMAHYANDCWDAELHSDRFGWIETVGIADRSAYDLSSHMKATGTDMQGFKKYDSTKMIKKKKIVPRYDIIGKTYREFSKKIIKKLEDIEDITDFNEIELTIDGKDILLDKTYFDIREVEEKVTGIKFIPHVIEPSYGLDRIFYFILEHNYKELDKKDEHYSVLSLPAILSPIKIGVFPLVNKDGLAKIARDLDAALRSADIMTWYDENGSIGRRYARMDEIGTPFCLTVDYQTKDDGSVTIRTRDTSEQVRILTSEVIAWVKDAINRG